MSELRFRAMGSDVHIVVVGDQRLLEQGKQRIEELEQRWSRFISTSEVSVLNANHGVPMRVSGDTFRLVRRAIEGWRATGGRFDPTVLGDVIRAGYDRPIEAVVVHSNGGVSALRRNCGGIVADAATMTVILPRETGFDPGGIGKGLAADIVVAELIAAGADGACVNIGGDLRVEGAGPRDDRWVIGVDHPSNGSEIARFSLAAGAVATSGIVVRAWTVGNERRHHLIDPATGRSSGTESIAVTALAREAAWAEIATKAALLSVPGWELDTLEELGCDGLIVGRDGTVRSTHNTDRYLMQPAAAS
jgi:thiamine biosynthesis lipoprotein